MRDYSKVNIENISRTGRYVDLNRHIITQLSPRELREIAKYQPEIKYRVDKEYFIDKPTYTVNRDNSKYNNGRCKTKYKLTRFGKVVIIGSLVVTLSIAGLVKLVVNAQGGKTTTEPTSVTNELPSYGTPITSELPGVEISGLTSNDVVVVEQHQESPEEILANYRRECIRNYCAIYAVNYDVVYDKIVELTDNFSSEEFLSGSIPGVTCKGEDVVTMDEELLFACTVRAMNQLPGRFGLNSSQLHSDVEEYEFNGDYNYLINYYANLFGVSEYRDILYGIHIAETGGTSNLLVNSNNFGGIRSSTGSGFDRQPTAAAGAIEYVATLKYVYFDLGLTTPETIQPKYAPGIENDVEVWLANVRGAMYSADRVLSVYDTETGLGLGS